MSCLCLGPKRAGKSHLLKALQDANDINDTSYTVPTMGTSVYNIRLPPNNHKNGVTDSKQSSTQPPPSSSQQQLQSQLKSIVVVEVGGSMAPLWRHYYSDVRKIIYVVDTSNLCQISAAGVLLYSLLAEPRLQRVRILLVLTKMDYAYRQMRNEALLMLQMSKLRKQIRQNITIVETSAVTRDGFDKIYDWLQLP